MAKYSDVERVFLDMEIKRISDDRAEEVDKMILGCAIKEVAGIDGLYIGCDLAHGHDATAVMRVVNAGTKDEKFEIVDTIQHGKI